ncbi:hypothetical protein [Curtobacterium sp. 9128]|uniref:hypothetical protein n=1 Tax=Curtobacterium sp. 9128 TaxID=1793722 RepID=UPI002481A19F|nr:hypothetical protein [Curtobacterium sp. 9128]
MPQQPGVLGGLLAHRLLGDADAGVGEEGERGEDGVVEQPGTLAALRLGLARLAFRTVCGADAVDAARDAGDAPGDPVRDDGGEHPAEDGPADGVGDESAGGEGHHDDRRDAAEDGQTESDEVSALRHEERGEAAGGEGDERAREHRALETVDARREDDHGAEARHERECGPPRRAVPAERDERTDHHRHAGDPAGERTGRDGERAEDADQADQRAGDADDTGRGPEEPVTFLCDEFHRCPGAVLVWVQGRS